MEETEDFLTDKKIKVIGEIADKLFEESDKEFYKKQSIDFKISENIEQINKQQWEDIWNEYFKSDICGNKFPTLFFRWLQERYLAPEKK